MSQEQTTDHEANPPGPTVEDGENDDAERFACVLEALDRAQLPLLGRSILQHRDSGYAAAAGATPSVGNPLYGSYHVLFPLTFDNGPRWLVKIPVNGVEGKWDERAAAALTSEANTMRFLRRETTIPVPDVLGFSATTRCPLRCPYIVLAFIDGLPLYDVWFGHRLQRDVVEPAVTRACRLRALNSIAAAMVQLGRFSFETGGSPLFGDGEGRGITEIGPARAVDNKAMLDRDEEGDGDGNGDYSPIYITWGPIRDPNVYYTYMLNLHPEVDHPFVRGLNMLLRQLIDWFPEAPKAPEADRPFVLAHPDFDIQNFLVGPDGTLRGIIDWDGVAAVPRSVGNERLPGWLTRDWDPTMYGYQASMEEGMEPAGLWEDSPETLTEYRCLYNDILLEHKNTRSSSICRLSLIADNMAIAAHDPMCRTSILQKIISEAWAAFRSRYEACEDRVQQPNFYDLAEMYSNSMMDDAVLGRLRLAFDALLSEEGLYEGRRSSKEVASDIYGGTNHSPTRSE